jgi:hypothetical protein
MKRFLLPAVLAVALLFPASASALYFYEGPIGSGANNAVVEIHVRFHAGEPRAVVASVHGADGFSWSNAPIPGGCTDYGGLGVAVPVNNRGHFHGRNNYSGNRVAIVTGKFKHRNRKIRGTLRLKGSFSGGCVDADTGPLGYVGRR